MESMVLIRILSPWLLVELLIEPGERIYVIHLCLVYWVELLMVVCYF